MRLALLMYNKMAATLNAMKKAAATERYLTIIHKLSYESKLITNHDIAGAPYIKPIHCFEINCLIYMNLARIKMVFKT